MTVPRANQRYTTDVLVMSAPLTTGVFAGWISRNSGCVATRNVGATIFGVTIQASLRTFILCFPLFLLKESSRSPNH